MERKARNPIVAYKREYKSQEGSGNYFYVSIEKDLLRDILTGSGTASLAVFINDHKLTETTPDIVVKASTGKGTETGRSGGQERATKSDTKYPF